MPTCQYKDLPVYFTDVGKGPAVVLIHGFLESSTMWDAYSAFFATRYRVICIDLFGHGKTGNLGYVHSMEEMADAVKTVLNHLRLKRCVIIGHSMGGYVALAFAEAFPKMLRCLCLFYSTAQADDAERKELRLRAVEVVKQNYKTFIKSTIPGLFASENLKTYQKEIAALINEALQMSPQGIVAALMGMRERKDREDLLTHGTYPVCIIYGKQDGRITVDSLQSQLAAPNVLFKLETPHGHMGHIEDAQECLTYLDYFIATVTKRA